MKIIELNSSQIIELQNALDHSSASIYLLPLCHQIRYLVKGIIPRGHVYVDQWPGYAHICCLITSDRFISKDRFDFDLATFDNIHGDQADFEDFLRALASERRWTLDRSVYIEDILVPMVNSFTKVLNQYGKIDEYWSGRVHTSLEKKNIEKYRKRLEEIVADFPQDFDQDVLRSSDVEIVCQNWHYAPDEAIPAYFKWLLETFPTICLRKKGTQELIAWAHSYNCGSLGNLFVTDEYRGRGLSEFLWLSIGLKMADFSNLKQYFNIRPNNVVSIKSADKAFPDDHEIGDIMTTWLFFYNYAQFPQFK